MHKYHIKLEQKDPKMTAIPAIKINNVDEDGLPATISITFANASASPEYIQS